ncbi:MAG: hypothetical protein ABIG10_01940 [bacterium]
MIYPIKHGYKAVCLDFDIIEEADTREEAEKEIRDAVEGYIINVCKNNLDDKLLNRHADKKYWEMYDRYQKLLFAKNQPTVKLSANIRKSSLFTIPIGELINSNASCAA